MLAEADKLDVQASCVWQALLHSLCVQQCYMGYNKNVTGYVTEALEFYSNSAPDGALATLIHNNAYKATGTHHQLAIHLCTAIGAS